MPSHQDIERFTLAFHERAVGRLCENEQRAEDALRVIERWNTSGMSRHGQRYRDEWRQLLRGDIDVLRKTVCAHTEHAATLRSMSPLGFLLSDAERMDIRRQTISA